MKRVSCPYLFAALGCLQWHMVISQKESDVFCSNGKANFSVLQLDGKQVFLHRVMAVYREGRRGPRTFYGRMHHVRKAGTVIAFSINCTYMHLEDIPLQI